MSHFVTLVIGEDFEDILEPYDENIEGEEHIDQTRDEIHEDFVRYKSELKEREKHGEELTDFQKFTLTLDKEDEEWVEGWCGRTLDEDGNTISTYNEDSKYDWYTIGGRWRGSLILKPGEGGYLSTPMFKHEDEPIIPDNCYDQATKGQIDWDAMNREAAENAGKIWDGWFSDDQEHCFYSPEYVEQQRKEHLERYGTKEEYIKRRGIWSPYAVVTRDGWYEPGEMLYFGVSASNSEDRDKFKNEFQEILSRYDDDTVLTIVDCHI